MKLFLGADHNGFALKQKVFAYLAKQKYDVESVGDTEMNPEDDFPQFAQLAALRVLGEDEGKAGAILICGSGQGMCMAANRFRGIRAIVGYDAHEVKMARNDTDSNVLCLPARMLEDNDELWRDIVDTWLKTPFAAAPRFKRRNAELDELL